MKKNNFLSHFNDGVKQMLQNGGEYFFGVYEAPEDDEQFLKYCNDFTSFRADYKNINWIDYDENSRKIFLNNDCAFNKAIYKNNPIVDYICREAHTWPPRSVNTWPVDF